MFRLHCTATALNFSVWSPPTRVGGKMHPQLHLVFTTGTLRVKQHVSRNVPNSVMEATHFHYFSYLLNYLHFVYIFVNLYRSKANILK